MGAKDPTKPEFQLAQGCLVDQLVGQFMARVCRLGSLVDPAHARTTLQSILKYNLRGDMHAHFNNMRVFAMADDAALLMASYPKGRPENPFPYFTEVMTGFEYAAAVGMLYEGLETEGLTCIGMIRARYDGLHRNPFDEAECGHHYARAMASWAAILALTGFHYSAVTGRMIIAPRPGRFPWSTGRAMGEYSVTRTGQDLNVMLRVHEGTVDVEMLEVEGRATFPHASRKPFKAGESYAFTMRGARGD